MGSVLVAFSAGVATPRPIRTATAADTAPRTKWGMESPRESVSGVQGADTTLIGWDLSRLRRSEQSLPDVVQRLDEEGFGEVARS